MTLAQAVPPSTRDYTVRTTVADRTRAVVQVCGELDGAGVALLEQVLEEHCAAGRRFLRISVVGMCELSSHLVALLERTHYRMLARRGTSIITGAGPAFMARLRELGLDVVLLVVEACADETGATVPGAAIPGAAIRGASRS